MSSKSKVVALAFAAVLIVAGAALYLYPRLTSQSPHLSAGTSFLSSGTIGNNVGGTWHREFYVTAGADNPIAFLSAYFGLVMPNYTFTVNTLPSNETQYLSGNSQFSVIGYGESGAVGDIFGATLYLPKATLATGIYVNLTAKFQNNISVKLSTGTIGGNQYTFINFTHNGNVTEGIFSHDGNYFIAFVYAGGTGVSKTGFVKVMSEEINALGNGRTVSYPSKLVLPSQAGSALGIGVDSSVYFSANVTNMSSLIHAFSDIYGSNRTSAGSMAGTAISTQYAGNLTGAGVTVFGNTTRNEIAVSSFATFRSSTYSSSLYELLNLQFSSNQNFSSTYHSGTIGGKQYFFVSGNLSANLSAQISLLVCVDGNSLIVQAVMAPGPMTYTQMTAFASAQISDI